MVNAISQRNTRELELALGLPDAEARAVLLYREKNGNFLTWEDLKKVPGLNVRKIEPKKDLLTF